MKRIINHAGLVIVIAILLSFNKKAVEHEVLLNMPMKAIYENSLEYVWSKKTVYESKLLSDMETMEPWRRTSNIGNLTLSDEKSYKGKHSILMESPTKGERPSRDGRAWGYVSGVLRVDNEDWTNWNRITLWIYPDAPGHKRVTVTLCFFNSGEEKIPSLNPFNGFNVVTLEPQKWNKVYWEIAHLGRERVTGVQIQHHLRGNEAGASETVRIFFDEAYLEKVDADHFEGWNVSPGEIAYNHAGYVKGFPKIAFTSENIGQKFTLKNVSSGKIVKESVVTSETTPTGTFRIMDFSDVNTDGTYILEVGKLKTKPFSIGKFSTVYRNSIVKTINHYYSQRCGMAIPGIHEICHLDLLSKYEGKSIPIHGGWHDAGDMSQALENTSEAAYSMMMLAEKLKKIDPVLSDRLLDEAEWGVNWMLRTRFEDGYRNVWCTVDMYTDNIIGTVDDLSSNARKVAFFNCLSATTEATAAVAFKDRNPFLSAHALKCAIEDYGYGVDVEPGRMNAELAGGALNAALAIYEATKDETYKKAAIEHANFLISCQQQDNLDSDVALKGFFYRTPEKNAIHRYEHVAHEQDVVVGLVKLSKLFPSEATEWKKAIRLYADYYKEICKYTAPYYMIPAGVYDLTRARSDNESEQIKSGIKLSERYYLKRFPVWHTNSERNTFRGNNGAILSQAKGLAVAANFLQDKTLLDIVYRTFDWHLGANPFAQSLMYGEGYRFPPQFSFSAGNLVGALQIGVQTHFNRDEPYWPSETCWVYKEIWVHGSTRWLMLVNEYI